MSATTSRPKSEILERPSPNHDARAGAVDMLLVHYTGMQSGQAALERLCDPAAKVSAHYLIEEDGRIFTLVPEARRAWHAGRAHWAGLEDINGCSVGIELVNPGHEFGYRPYPRLQLESFTRLAMDVVIRHRIPRRRILGHSDVAPARKQDPGELFPWHRLWMSGIGFWPSVEFYGARKGGSLRTGDSGGEVAALRDAFRAFGYGLRPGGDQFDDDLAAVVTAFQRHWRQTSCTGIADPETRSILRHLLDRVA